MSLESALAVTMIMGMKGREGSALRRLQTSIPSILGIIMSSRIRSGCCAPAIASASAPSVAVRSS